MSPLATRKSLPSPVSSRKLTDGEDWHDFTPGSLMVFERGDVVYGADV